MTGDDAPNLTDVSMDGVDVPVIEISTASRHQESRAAMAVVAGLLERGVNRRDIVVVARDLDEYQELLTHAAHRYGISVNIWNQLPTTNTRVFNLIHRLCSVLGGEDVTGRELRDLLALGWIPPNPSDSWPVTPQTAFAGDWDERESVSLDDWHDITSEPDWPDQELASLVEWLVDVPAPKPQTIETVLGGVVSRYRELVLPAIKSGDDPSLSDTQRAARAVVRVDPLVQEAVEKYRRRLRAGEISLSWTQLTELLESIGTQSPGRRTRADANGVDVIESNDIWAREIPYVIGVGMVEGLWPQEPDSVFAAEFQQALLAGSGQAEQLVPRTRWVGGRDLDQFEETIRTATAGVVLTRHTKAADGTVLPRSSLLSTLDTDELTSCERQALLSEDPGIPQPLETTLSGYNEGEP